MPGKEFRRSTSKQVASQDRSQSVTEAVYDANEPPRKTHERLGPWLELANLLPPPPSRDELRFEDPGPIGSWQTKCRATPPAKFLNSFMRSRLAQAPAIAATMDLRLLRDDPDEAERFLHLAAEIAAALQTLVSAGSPKVLKAAGQVPMLIKRLYEAPAASWSAIWMTDGVVTTLWADPFRDFLAALKGVEAKRVRQCPTCGHFFYALRKDQKACSKRCNAARRVRDWRANQARHEYRSKLRGAGLLTEKKRKRRPK